MRLSPRNLLAPALLALVLLWPAAPAYAERLGNLVVYPGASLDTASIKVVTERGCPSTADAFYVRAFGHGFPADGLIVTATTSAGLSHTDGFEAYFSLTMKDFAADNHTQLQGTYQIKLFCIDAFRQDSKGEFTGSIKFSSPTRYEAVGTSRPSPSPSASVSAVPTATATGFFAPTDGPDLAGAAGSAAAAAKAKPRAAEGGWLIWLGCTVVAVALVWGWQRRRAWLDAGPRRAR